MKKGFLKLSVLIAALFIGVIGVNASIDAVGSNCQLGVSGEATSTCDLQLAISGDSTIKTGDVFTVAVQNPNNIKDNKVTLTAAEGWTVDGAASKEITLGETKVKVTVKYTGTETISASTIKVMTGSYVKDDIGQGCGFNYGLVPNACSSPTAEDGTKYYYGKDGNQIKGDDAEAKYYKDCFVCATPDSENSDGKYHGIDGTPLESEGEYYKQCFSCATPDSENGDGKYHDKDGKVTDEAGYKKACVGTCHQEKGPDKKWHYYDYENKEITADEFKNICQENPKSGSFIPYVGIAAGIALIGIATIMVRKQTKLRKI